MARGWLSARSLAAFAGGSLAGVVASRMLPPILAQTLGSMGANGGDPFARLIEDHRQFSDLLSRMSQSDAGALQRTRLLLQLKRALTKHALAEEDIIYPLLHDEAGERQNVQDLYADHAQIKMHLHALEDMPKDDPRWPQRAHELKRLIDQHARHEEQVDFPRLRQVMDDEALARLSGSVMREKAMVL